MAKSKKTWAPRATDKLWGAIRIWGTIFIVMAATLAGLLIHKAVLLGAFAPLDYMTQEDLVGSDIEAVATLGVVVLFLLAYVVGAFLVLCWYLRSIRNARVLHRGIQTSPTWVVWYFIIPILSLFRPYSMTSELWRSSKQPEGWKGARDPVALRWWWGALLGAGFISLVGDGICRSAETAGMLQTGTVLVASCYVLQGLAGVLFLGIGGRISKRQTALVVAGHRPPEPTIPAWSA
jgi:hypothetical protein